MSSAGAFMNAAGLPTGSRDVLPTEARELHEIEEGLRRAFDLYGYREIRTPAIELDAVIDRAEGERAAAYRLFDDAGRLLTLRPDPTIPVARLVATRLGERPDPVRVFYVATAFRPPTPGRAEAIELHQAGVELVGASGPAADAEVIAVLASALGSSGLSEHRIAVGSVVLIEAVLGALAIGEPLHGRLMAALRARNHVAWRAAAHEADVSGDAGRLLVDVPSLRGDASVLDRVSRAVPAATPAADELAATLNLLGRHGVAPAVVVDLGIVRERRYYSGIVIEAYAEGVGSPVAVGGRYDSIAARYGRDRPAVGVAIALPELHRAVVAAGAGPQPRRPGVVLVDGLDAALDAARAARRAGVPVVSVPDAADEARRLAEAEGWRFVARRDGDEFLVEDMEARETFRCAALDEIEDGGR